MEKQPILIITATRAAPAKFAERPLGQSLPRVKTDGAVVAHVTCDNSTGLPAIYNRHITEERRSSILVFVHDDVWLDDVFFGLRVRQAMAQFDVVGLAGNTRLLPQAPAWGFKDDAMKWDTGYLTGLVCHGKQPFGKPSVYGPTPAAAQLLDGVLLVARCSALLDGGVRFDEQFGFHFYDLDFSRQANVAGLKVGTWPIGVTHVSGGAFNSAAWKKARTLYREKWPVGKP